ncbi:MAG: SDR family oxidoreductase [Ignavibacteria bacterium]
MQTLENKTIIVTGGSKGIGRVLALRLAREKAKIVITGRNDKDLNNTRDELNKITPDVLAVNADVSVHQDVKRIVGETVKKFKDIHFLINNAGIMTHKAFNEFGIDEWKKVFDVNVFGTMMMCKESLPYMEKLSDTTGATIVNISSMSGRQGYERGTAYSASKYALIGFAESLFKEVRPKNIRVITVYPSYVETSVQNEDELKTIGKGVYMRAEDVADTIIHTIKLPQRAMLKTIEVWGTNP